MIPKKTKIVIKEDVLKELEDFENAFPNTVDYSDDPDDIGFQDQPDFWNDPAHDHD